MAQKLLLLVIPPVLFHNQGARVVFAIVEAPGRTHVRLHSTEVNDVIVAVNVAVTVGTRKVSSSLPANTLRMTHVLSSGSKRAGMRVRVTGNVVASRALMCCTTSLPSVRAPGKV